MSEENKELKDAISYIISLKIPFKIIEDKQAYLEFISIEKYETNDQIDYDLICANDFVETISNLMSFYSGIQDKLKFEIESENEISKREKIFYILLNFINLASVKSNNFSVQFLKNGGVEACMRFLTNQEFLNKDQNSEIVYMLILNLTNIVYQTSDEYKQLWKDLDLVSVFLKIATLNHLNIVPAYGAITNLLDDKRIERLKDIEFVCRFLCNLLKKFRNELKKVDIHRSVRQYLFKGKIVEVKTCGFMDDKNFVWGIKEILDLLYKLSISPKLKEDIYFKNDIKSCLNDLINEGNHFEQNYILQLLAQLTFSTNVSKDLVLNVELMKSLENFDFFENKMANDCIEENKKFYENSINVIKQIEWNISERTNTKQMNKIINEENNDEHIMISYNSGSRPLCLEIKNYVESLGYKVWIDIDNTNGSYLESMAEAVENSSCILMCVTEKYRQSISCQIEAQYAFKMNKKIIPIIMQKGYDNIKGWLETIILDKTCIDFTKYEYEECVKKLEDELNAHFNDKTFVTSKIRENGNLVENWSDNDVHEWFIKNNLSILIYNHFKPFYGFVLKRLYHFQIEFPEIYYQSLKEITDLNSSDIIVFSAYLDQLLNSNKLIRNQ